MTKQYTILIEGIPEGWEVIDIEVDPREFPRLPFNTVQATIQLKKTKPREITLVENDSERRVVKNEWYGDRFGLRGKWQNEEPSINEFKIWRVKEE